MQFEFVHPGANESWDENDGSCVLLVSSGGTRALLAGSKLVTITSKMEGSSNVLSEALASGVPVIAAKISGLMGTLGKRFVGYYPVSDTAKLRRLLLKAENDRRFYGELKRQCRSFARLVRPEWEIAAWRRLLREIV